MRAINLLGPEVALSGSPNAVFNSMLVRCVTTTSGVVYRAIGMGGLTTPIGTATVLATEPTYIFKDAGDTLSCSGSVLATPITFMY